MASEGKRGIMNAVVNREEICKKGSSPYAVTENREFLFSINCHRKFREVFIFYLIGFN